VRLAILTWKRFCGTCIVRAPSWSKCRLRFASGELGVRRLALAKQLIMYRRWFVSVFAVSEQLSMGTPSSGRGTQLAGSWRTTAAPGKSIPRDWPALTSNRTRGYEHGGRGVARQSNRYGDEREAALSTA